MSDFKIGDVVRHRGLGDKVVVTQTQRWFEEAQVKVQGSGNFKSHIWYYAELFEISAKQEALQF